MLRLIKPQWYVVDDGIDVPSSLPKCIKMWIFVSSCTWYRQNDADDCYITLIANHSQHVYLQPVAFNSDYIQSQTVCSGIIRQVRYAQKHRSKSSSWNSHQNSVVDASTVNAFKARLDKFWSHQAVRYDFTADLTGTGNRSEEVLKSQSFY